MPPRKKVKKAAGISFVRGLKLPTKSEGVQDLLYPEEDFDTLPKEFKPHNQHFKPIPKPTCLDDWLAQVVEEKQPFYQFLCECPWASSRPVRGTRMAFNPDGGTITETYPELKIYLVQLGDFDALSPSLDVLTEGAKHFFGIPVVCLPPLLLEGQGSNFHVKGNINSCPVSISLDARTKKYDGKMKRQIQVNSLLNSLTKFLPRDGLCLVALTMDDLYDDEADLFVAGMACRRRVAAFSFFRYDPTLSFSTEFWYKATPLSPQFSGESSSGTSAPQRVLSTKRVRDNVSPACSKSSKSPERKRARQFKGNAPESPLQAHHTAHDELPAVIDLTWSDDEWDAQQNAVLSFEPDPIAAPQRGPGSSSQNPALADSDMPTVPSLQAGDQIQHVQVLTARSLKLLNHELGHLLGLDHCLYGACIMNGSGHLEEDFRQPMFLCPCCLRKMHVLCGFDVKLRYKSLQEFYSSLGMHTEVEWIEKRLEYIE